jgi:hypothetical protein
MVVLMAHIPYPEVFLFSSYISLQFRKKFDNFINIRIFDTLVSVLAKTHAPIAQCCSTLQLSLSYQERRRITYHLRTTKSSSPSWRSISDFSSFTTCARRGPRSTSFRSFWTDSSLPWASPSTCQTSVEGYQSE